MRFTLLAAIGDADRLEHLIKATDALGRPWVIRDNQYNRWITPGQAMELRLRAAELVEEERRASAQTELLTRSIEGGQALEEPHESNLLSGGTNPEPAYMTAGPFAGESGQQGRGGADVHSERPEPDRGGPGGLGRNTVSREPESLYFAFLVIATSLIVFLVLLLAAMFLAGRP